MFVLQSGKEKELELGELTEEKVHGKVERYK